MLDRGGKVFKQSAPVIKLPPGATEDDHLAVLGLLNSSTACFWMKQVFHDKGSTVDSQGACQTTVAFENFREFTGTGLQRFPVPQGRPTELARKLDDLAQRLQDLTPRALLHRWQSRNIKGLFDVCEREWTAIREQMIALQEELDWECYRLYGLVNEDLTYGAEPPPLRFGRRRLRDRDADQDGVGEAADDLVRAAQSGTDPWTASPSGPQDYQDLVLRRMEVIATNPNIRLIEQPEYKRRWNTEPWDRSAREGADGPGSWTVSNPTSTSTAG